ncbi:MAG TPA: ThiF family adenylyltransferase [Methanosarcina sp.]
MFLLYFPTHAQKIFSVLNATPSIIGSIQANETIKFLTGQGKLLEGKFLFWNGSSGNFSEISLLKPNTYQT